MLEPSDIILRDNSLITHSVADFGLFQSGIFLAKQTGMLTGFIYTNPLRVQVKDLNPRCTHSPSHTARTLA